LARDFASRQAVLVRWRGRLHLSHLMVHLSASATVRCAITRSRTPPPGRRTGRPHHRHRPRPTLRPPTGNGSTHRLTLLAYRGRMASPLTMAPGARHAETHDCPSTRNVGGCTGSPVDVPAILGGLYYDLVGAPSPRDEEIGLRGGAERVGSSSRLACHRAAPRGGRIRSDPNRWASSALATPLISATILVQCTSLRGRISVADPGRIGFSARRPGPHHPPRPGRLPGRAGRRRRGVPETRRGTQLLRARPARGRPLAGH
jgi:hypothetical protein